MPQPSGNSGAIDPRRHATTITVDGEHLEAAVVAPSPRLPGVLLVHGWDADQAHYEDRSDMIGTLGCVCLTFNLRGHGAKAAEHEDVTREDNLQDVLAAYDHLAARADVDPGEIAVIGTSYGGYLAALLTALRPVRWLGLRVPAAYPDGDWHVPKARLDREALGAYRKLNHAPSTNRALAALANFAGDALLVESGCDQTIPRPVIVDYRRALEGARSLTYARVEGADHALSQEEHRLAYKNLLDQWLDSKVARAG